MRWSSRDHLRDEDVRFLATRAVPLLLVVAFALGIFHITFDAFPGNKVEDDVGRVARPAPPADLPAPGNHR
jgi:hypothetical protein